MDKLESIFTDIKSMIDKQTGEEGIEFVHGKFSGIGWLKFHYVCSTYNGEYPRLLLKRQKDAVHLYALLWDDGKPVLERYICVFGKSAVGKSCVRIKTLDDKRVRALHEIIDMAIVKHNFM